ncbi:IS30 family transposase, partial [Enterococcus sp. BWB1-3]|nr:IS30 family transposase [Enterococcus sp. BWB1-3]MCB5953100.1 IS30 family transposase [Enterococcus sp. BWT-B8]
VDEAFVQSVASKRNHIPRKSLNYRTPMEVFLSYMDDEMVSRLI